MPNLKKIAHLGIGVKKNQQDRHRLSASSSLLLLLG